MLYLNIKTKLCVPLNGAPFPAERKALWPAKDSRKMNEESYLINIQR